MTDDKVLEEFEVWWKSKWKANGMPEIMNEAIKEIAMDSWQASSSRDAERIASLDKERERLAAAQADNVRLREALHNALSCGSPFWTDDAQLLCLTQGREALAQSPDHSALDAYVAEKTAALQAKVDALKWQPIETAKYSHCLVEFRDK